MYHVVGTLWTWAFVPSTGCQGAVILDEKERLTATYHAIMSFLVFTTWYLRSHQSPRLESSSEGVAVEGYLPRILRGGGVWPVGDGQL